MLLEPLMLTAEVLHHVLQLELTDLSILQQNCQLVLQLCKRPRQAVRFLSKYITNFARAVDKHTQTDITCLRQHSDNFERFAAICLSTKMLFILVTFIFSFLGSLVAIWHRELHKMRYK